MYELLKLSITILIQQSSSAELQDVGSTPFPQAETHISVLKVLTEDDLKILK